MPGRHVPERTCVACRTQQPKRTLVRIVRHPTGRVAIDPTGKAPGRGAYLCRQGACWRAGLKKDGLVRALKASIAAEDLEALQAHMVALDDVDSEAARRLVAEGSLR